MPNSGQPYIPAAPEQFSLLVTRKDGSTVTVPASDHVTFKSVRGYASVKAVMRRDVLASLDAKSATIVVAPGAALIPEAVAGDPNPISEAEVAFATKSLREHGNEVFDTQPDITDSPDAVDIGQVDGRVSFEHVAYQYDGSDNPLYPAVVISSVCY